MIVTPSANLSVEVKSGTWVRYLTRAALASAGLLLLSNLPLVSTRLHAYLSAVPLAVAAGMSPANWPLPKTTARVVVYGLP